MLLPVSKVRVQYGRNEMRSIFLVAAKDAKTAKSLANAAAPVPAYDSDITVDEIPRLYYKTKTPTVVCRL